jgi:hypothetical protein
LRNRVNASRTSAGVQGFVARKGGFFGFDGCRDLAAADFGCLGFAATLPQDLWVGFRIGLWVIFGMIVYT